MQIKLKAFQSDVSLKLLTSHNNLLLIFPLMGFPVALIWNEMRFFPASPSAGSLLRVKVEPDPPPIPRHSQHVWQRGCRALHSDERPLQCRSPHTSPQPANWGLALQLRPLAPDTAPSPVPHHCLPSTVPPSPPSKPNVGLQHSSLRHMVPQALLVLPQAREIRVPAQCQHSSMTGVLLQGFPVSFHASVEQLLLLDNHWLWQVDTGPGASHQSSASGSELPLWAEGPLGGHLYLHTVFTELG